MPIAHNHIEECLVTECGRLRAVLAEQRALIRKLLADRDQQVAAILQARTALREIDRVAHKIDTEAPMELQPEEEVIEPKNSNRIRGLAEKIAGTMTLSEAAAHIGLTKNGG